MTLAAECIVGYELERTEMLLVPVLTALGAKFKKGRLSVKQKRKRRQKQRRAQGTMSKQERGEARDWHNYMSATRYGIRYVDVKDGKQVGRTHMVPPMPRDTLHDEGGE